MSTTTPVTADQLLHKPDDGYRYELVEGELRQMSPAGSEHGAVIVKISYLVQHLVKQTGLGVVFSADTGFVIKRDPDTVLAPDVSFVRAERVNAGPLP